MLEKEIEDYFVWSVEMAGGKTWKFTSPAQRGVSDRIVCMPDGKVYFVELKKKGGNLSELQKIFGAEMKRLNTNYEVLWSIEEIDKWIKRQ